MSTKQTKPIKARMKGLARLLSLHLYEPNEISRLMAHTAAQIITSGDYGYILNLAAEMQRPLVDIFPDSATAYPFLERHVQPETSLPPHLQGESEIVNPSTWFGVLNVTAGKEGGGV